MSLRRMFIAATVLVASVAFAATQPPRVFDGGAPDDERLYDLHDIDHPVTFTPAFADKEAWRKRADQLRVQVLVAEGLWPMPARAPLDAVIHGKIDRDDYTVEKVFFRSYPGHYVSGSLFRPKNASGKIPAVLCPHGHWPGGRFYDRPDAEAKKQIDEGAETTMEGAKFPIQARCHMLARMGCVVFLYDMVGYADSTAIEHRTGFSDVEGVLRLQTFMGLQTWNSIRAADFIQSLPEVDPTRIAITGASGGATQTLILDAVDDRLAVAFPAVMVSESMQGGCICENAPLLRVGTNNVELAGLFAPKPLGMTAANDWTAELETDGLPKLKSIYSLFDAKNNVMGKHFPFEHNYNQVSRELMYNWMNDHLKLGWPSPVKEKPFDPIPPKELSVYDDQHPRPADTADAKSLRRQMTEASDSQIESIWKNDPTEYAKTVGTALRVMIHDDLPAADQVTVRHASGPQLQSGIVTETGTLGRKGAGDSVPYVSLVPEGWQGTVVVVVQPDGKASLFDESGAPTAGVRKLLDRKCAVVSADLYLTGEYQSAKPTPPNYGYSKQQYAGFYYAYNRGTMGNRVRDLLTEIAFVHGWKGCTAVDVVASEKSGPIAVLACACAGETVHRAAINLGGFDFDQVTEPADPMLLPGALKYGGIYGFVPLCRPADMLICGARSTGIIARATGEHRQIIEESRSPEQLLDWVSEKP
jgi:dienelactone hydrolase